MKRKILSLLVAICLIAGLLPMTTLAAPEWETVRISIGTRDNEVFPVEGGEAFYFKTDAEGAATLGGDETDYNIKVQYPQDGVPTVWLKDAYIKDFGGIFIGRHGSYTGYHNYPAKIVVESDSVIHAEGLDGSPILSFALMDLTITGVNGSTLDTQHNNYYGSGTHAAIRSQGSIIISDVNINIRGLGLWMDASRPGTLEEVDNYLRSDNGDIVIDNAKLNISTEAGDWLGDDGTWPAVHAPNGSITIKNGSAVAVNYNRNNPVFDANEIIIDESFVKVAAKNENSTVFAVAPTLNFADLEATASTTAPTGEFDGSVVITAPEDAAAYDEVAATTYKYVSIAPHVHAPEEDDGDCTTAIKCSTCGEELTAAKDAHTPEADDGDCTTAQKCTVCDTVIVAAKDAHTPANADDDCATEDLCSVCGKVAVPAGECTPEADDGDCTTAVKCAICGKEAVAAKDAHTPAEDDGDCTTAINCTVCGKETTAAKEAHTPAEDDGDCTTAINCTVCGKETTAAKEAHAYTDNADTTCDNEGCTNTRKVDSTGTEPGTNGNPQTGDNSNITLWIALLAVSVVGIIAVVVFGKKRFAAK